MSSSRKQQPDAVKQFETELDTPCKRDTKVEAWFKEHPEIEARVRARLDAAAKDREAASPTQIWRALKNNFKVPFADYTFRKWVRERYDQSIFRTRGAS